MTRVLCTLVHPHAGEPSGLQRPSSGLFRLAADGGAARKAGVLHGHHADAAAGDDGRTRAEQKPQTDAEEVRTGRIYGICITTKDVSAFIYTVLFSVTTKNKFRMAEKCGLCRPNVLSVVSSVCVCVSRSETVVERMLCNWMSICLYQFLRVTHILSLVPCCFFISVSLRCVSSFFVSSVIINFLSVSPLSKPVHRTCVTVAPFSVGVRSFYNLTFLYKTSFHTFLFDVIRMRS